ncbi:MAG TPA: hypothetical protein VN175_16010 [Rhizomicrobium sp.]|jgi:hypothetical protein|nr:hypothetical protein [Rhizomicrobium sp.]
MPIDPVIPLLEEICAAEDELQRQSTHNILSYCSKRAELIAVTLARIALLYDGLYEVMPTSAIGAGALLDLVRRWLPPHYAHYEQHLVRIGCRLQAGRRSIDDLVWLRGLAAALDDDAHQSDNLRVILNAAILGASRPILIFRSVIQDPDHAGGSGAGQSRPVPVARLLRLHDLACDCVECDAGSAEHADHPWQ